MRFGKSLLLLNIPLLAVEASKAFIVSDLRMGMGDMIGKSIFFDVLDPNTGNKTLCGAGWGIHEAAPADWIACDDTFSMKLNYWVDLGRCDLELKHQYKGAGLPCANTNDSNCTTSRAYISYRAKMKAYSIGCGGEGTCSASWIPARKAPVFSVCDSGCGLDSGAF